MSDEVKLELSQPVPHWSVCRARNMGLADFAECCVPLPLPWRCPHVVPFGNGRFCRHPRQGEIIAKTQNESGQPHHGFNEDEPL